MKSITAALDAHLAKTSTTLATCWKVTRTDGEIFSFTDHDRDLVLSGLTYSASAGYTRTAIQSSADLSVDNLDLEGGLSSDSITEADIHAGLWDFATIEIFMVNWADLTQGTLKQRKGTLGQVRTGRNHFVAELRGLMQQLQQNVGRVYAVACDADVGDDRCTVNLIPLTITSTVTAVTSQRVFSDSARTESSGYFDRGKVTFTSGLNAGLQMDVKLHTPNAGSPPAGAVIELQLPMPYVIAPGDGYTMSPGCLKTPNVCKVKFNNYVNYRGFEFVPGMDQIGSGGL